MPRRKRCSVLLAAVVFSVGFSPRLKAIGIGTSTSNFLKLAIGARPAGMGEAYLALSDDSSSIYWNPAGLPQMSLAQFSAMHLNWFDNITYDYIGYIQPYNGMDFGLGLTYLNAPPVNNTLDPNAVQSSASEFSASLAYAAPLTDQLMFGLDLKPIFSDLAGSSALGAAVDAGVLFKPFGPSFSMGMLAQNLGIIGAYQDSSDPLPLSIGLGLAYRLYNARQENYLNVVADAIKSIDAKVKYNVGAEFWFFNTLALRGGYKFSEGGSDLGTQLDINDLSTAANFTLGAGFKLGPFQGDYAFEPFGELGFTHRISVSWTFGYWPSLQPSNNFLAGTPKFEGQNVSFSPIENKDLNGVKEWKINVYDKDGVMLKTLGSAGAIPKLITWDGVDERGQKVSPDAPLRYELSEIDYNGKHLGAEGNIAQAIKPKDMLLGGPQFSADEGGLVFKPKSDFSANVKEWKLDIKTADGVVIKTITGTGAIPKSLVWNPKAAENEGFIQKDVSQIQYSLEVKDNAGAAKVVSDMVRFSPKMQASQDITHAEVGAGVTGLVAGVASAALKEYHPQTGKEVMICSLPSITSFKETEAKNSPFVFRIPENQKIKNWRLEITSPEGSLVKTFKGDSLPPQIVWDGKDANNMPVYRANECRFNLVVSGSDNQEKRVTETQAVRQPFQVSSPSANVKKLSGLWFSYLSADIRPEIKNKLHELALILKKEPSSQVLLQGYSFEEGERPIAAKLSQERADAVLRYLIENEGVVLKNIAAIGYGEDRPLEGEKALNRRVDVLIIAK